MPIISRFLGIVKEELLKDWELCQKSENPEVIAPLE